MDLKQQFFTTKNETNINKLWLLDFFKLFSAQIEFFQYSGTSDAAATL